MIRKVGDTVIQPQHNSICHCGRIRLLIELPDGIVNPRRCNCSICRRKGSIVASVKLDRLVISSGHDSLRIYQFNTYTAVHYFCSHCGIFTHQKSRACPDEYVYNVGCLEGVNPLLITGVTVVDGINHLMDY